LAQAGTIVLAVPHGLAPLPSRTGMLFQVLPGRWKAMSSLPSLL
jgi:hypothetical protein